MASSRFFDSLHHAHKLPSVIRWSRTSSCSLSLNSSTSIAQGHRLSSGICFGFTFLRGNDVIRYGSSLRQRQDNRSRSHNWSRRHGMHFLYIWNKYVPLILFFVPLCTQLDWHWLNHFSLRYFFLTPAGLPKGVASTQRQYLTNLMNAAAGNMKAILRRGDDIPAPDPLAHQKGLLLLIPCFHATAMQSFITLITAVGGKVRSLSTSVGRMTAMANIG